MPFGLRHVARLFVFGLKAGTLQSKQTWCLGGSGGWGVGIMTD